MALADITHEAVLAAIAEFDEKGRDTFLASYGFADAKRYWLVWEGERYPSKAIAGVAHKYVAGEQLHGSNSFKGGEAAVLPKLRSLGFVIEADPRNPDWSRDELILAMDLYYANREAIPGKESKSVVGLSDLLNAMHRAIGTQAGNTIRNANGVYLKLMNLRALDPEYTSQGKVGMQSGGQLEKAIWAEYYGRADDLAHDAAGVRQAIAQLRSAPPVPGAEPDIYEGEEGGVVIRLHKTYERDARLIKKKRNEAKASGALVCEVCGFDYAATYGALGSDYIEVHHTRPVHMMKAGSTTRLSDLALLCASCHRMAHRKRVPLTLDELRTALASAT